MSSLFRTISLTNKVVLVTGASSGIGEAIAEAFAKANCKLVIIARRKERLEDLEKRLKNTYKVKVFAQTLDLQDLNAIGQLQESLPQEFRQVDILVNNAGVAKTGFVDKLNIEDIQYQVATNLIAPVVLNRIFSPGMVQRQFGHIINISSIAADLALEGHQMLSATKHGLKGISDTIRKELLKTPIRVTEIRPGIVKTEAQERLFGKEMAEDFLEQNDHMEAIDIAESTLYAATRPLHIGIDVIILNVAQQKGNLGV